MKKLIIVESPNKVKTIAGYIKTLQDDGFLDNKDTYEVDSSVGHIMELKSTWMPKSKEDIDNFEKTVIRGKGKAITALKSKVKKFDIVLIATDPDREGEAIADDLIDKLNIKKFERIIFAEITKDAIHESILNPVELDINMVNAQKARMLLDRIFGYKLSNWTKKKLRNTQARSAGRVQSPTLKLVVERELLIEGFKPISFYKVEQEINDEVVAVINLDKDMVDGKKNLLEHSKKKEYKDIVKGNLKVTKVIKSQSNGGAKVPFKQSSAFRSASSKLGISATSARNAMQALFEKGHISYPRTDSTRYSQTFINKAQKHIKNKFGEKYIASEIKGTKDGAQGAHEALRVTNPKLEPFMLKGEIKNNTEMNVYKMIYENTIQSLMVPPRRESLSYILDDNGIQFKMASSKVIFDGYLILTGWEKSTELPVLKEGDTVTSKSINFMAGATKPKGRFNEGSLIGAMEDSGIGRPSTFSSTVSTLINRGYVKKDGAALVATRTGKAIIMTLMLYFDGIIKEEYTSELEKILDQISIGERGYLEVVQSFYEKLMGELDLALIKRKPKAADKTQYIDVSDVDSIKAKQDEVSIDDEAYTKDFNKLLVTFLNYCNIDNKNIEIDYSQYVKNEKENFAGPIVMPQAPRRGYYVVEGDKAVIFDPEVKYNETDTCPTCKKNPVVYSGGVSKRGRIWWFKTCAGWKTTKCKTMGFVNQNSEIFQILEELYLKSEANFEREETESMAKLIQKLTS